MLLGMSLTTGQTARASNVFQNDDTYGVDKAVDGDEDTRWATDASTGPCWLEVDFGKPRTFDRALINECVDFGVRVRAYDLEYKDGAKWKVFHSGKGIGPHLEASFTPVTARIVRLNITEGHDGPTIREFQLFAPPAHRITISP
jgi:alpha-L-fucosidase